MTQTKKKKILPVLDTICIQAVETHILWISRMGHIGMLIGTVIWTNKYWGFPILGTLPHKKVDLVNWAHGQAQCFRQIHIWAPQDQTLSHKVDIMGFLNGAHEQAHILDCTNMNRFTCN